MKNVWILLQIFVSSIWSIFRSCTIGDDPFFIFTVKAFPGRDPDAPNNLPADIPIPEIGQPLQGNFFKSFRREFNFFAFDYLYGIVSQRSDFDVPLRQR